MTIKLEDWPDNAVAYQQQEPFCGTFAIMPSGGGSWWLDTNYYNFPAGTVVVRPSLNGINVKPIKWTRYDCKHRFGQGLWQGNILNHCVEILEVPKEVDAQPFYCAYLSKSFDTAEEAQAAVQERFNRDIFSYLTVEAK